MQTQDAMDFFDRLSKGTKDYKTIALEHKKAGTLEGVEMHPVSKSDLAKAIERLPNEMLEADEDTDVDEEEASSMIDDAESVDDIIDEDAQDGDMSVITEDAVVGLEELLEESLQHPELAPPNMKKVIDELSLQMLFILGVQAVALSVEEAGDIEDFRVQE